MKLELMTIGTLLAGAACALEPAPQPPAVQAQLAAEFAKAKMVTEDLKPYERALTLTAYVPDDRIVWACGDKPEAVFELRDKDGALVTGEGLMALFNNLPPAVEFAEITIVQYRGHDAGHEARGVFPCYVFTRENGKVTGQYCPPKKK